MLQFTLQEPLFDPQNLKSVGTAGWAVSLSVLRGKQRLQEVSCQGARPKTTHSSFGDSSLLSSNSEGKLHLIGLRRGSHVHWMAPNSSVLVPNWHKGDSPWGMKSKKSRSCSLTRPTDLDLLSNRSHELRMSRLPNIVSKRPVATAAKAPAHEGHYPLGTPGLRRSADSQERPG